MSEIVHFVDDVFSLKGVMENIPQIAVFMYYALEITSTGLSKLNLVRSRLSRSIAALSDYLQTGPHYCSTIVLLFRFP